MIPSRIFCCNTKTWRQGNAIQFLFFSDNSLLLGSPDRRREVSEYIECKLSGNVFSASLEADSVNMIDAKLEDLMEIDPSVVSTEKAGALLWIRFAIQAMRQSVIPAQTFLDWYALWRYQVAQGSSCALIVSKNERSRPTSVRSTFDYAGKRYDCYPIDYFFFNPSVHAPLNSDVEWILLRKNQENDESVNQKRVERIVGANVYQAIHDCIERVAPPEVETKNRISGLTSEKINGRYISTRSREDLADRIKKRFRSIEYSKDTIVRVLSQFVACPQHREAKRSVKEEL